MSQPYLGQITMFGGNFAPRGYALCDGQLLSINQYSALFSLIGTIYGGNGTTNFALPNLQSRLSNHMGRGPGLSLYALGQSAGEPAVTITSSTMPGHTHMLYASAGLANTGTVGSSVAPATSTGSHTAAFYATEKTGEPPLTKHAMAAAACNPSGGNLPHDNLMPSLCITFIIALQGIFPSRN